MRPFAAWTALTLAGKLPRAFGARRAPLPIPAELQLHDPARSTFFASAMRSSMSLPLRRRLPKCRWLTRVDAADDAEEADASIRHGTGAGSERWLGANTAAGHAALAQGSLHRQVSPPNGEFYIHDLRAAGVEFATKPADVGVPTARSMILVTPDGHRTMNTFLGAAQHLPASALDERQIADSAVLYLEGYLWDPEAPRYAMIRAIEVARAAGRKVAFTLSDSFCIDRHRDGFNALIDEGRIDILFANEAEIQALAGVPHLETAVNCPSASRAVVVTRSEHGALATQGANVPDLRPSGQDSSPTGERETCFRLASGRLHSGKASSFLTLGPIAAAEVIQHYGARPMQV